MIEGINTGNIKDVAKALEKAVINNTPAMINALLPYVTQPLLAVVNIQDNQVDYFKNRELRQTASTVLKNMSETDRTPDQLANMTRQFCLYLAHLAEHHNHTSLASDLIKMQKLEPDCEHIRPLKLVMVQENKKQEQIQAVAAQKALFQENKAILKKQARPRPVMIKRRRGNGLT